MGLSILILGDNSPIVKRLITQLSIEIDDDIDFILYGDFDSYDFKTLEKKYSTIASIEVIGEKFLNDDYAKNIIIDYCIKSPASWVIICGDKRTLGISVNHICKIIEEWRDFQTDSLNITALHSYDNPEEFSDRFTKNMKHTTKFTEILLPKIVNKDYTGKYETRQCLSRSEGKYEIRVGNEERKIGDLTNCEVAAGDVVDFIVKIYTRKIFGFYAVGPHAIWSV